MSHVSRQPGPLDSGRAGSATAVVGLQWGDEGKGKLVDLLAAEHDAVVRYNGGANAGHSVVVDGERFALHVVPSGILYPGKLAVVGNGVVVDPEGILAEIDGLRERGVDTSGLVISDRAHVVMPYHKAEDKLREMALSGVPDWDAGIGTTLRGIGPCYAEKCLRSGAVRVGDLLRPEALRRKVRVACVYKNALFEGVGGGSDGAAERRGDGGGGAAGWKPAPPREAGQRPATLGTTGVERFDAEELTERMLAAGERLGPMVRDTTYLLHELDSRGGRILFEGGNATLLDLDHGTYPYVTSSSCSVLGIGPGTGFPPQRIGRVLGVMKAYTTRVGRGPMPTELGGEVADQIRERGREYGTTTGRPRRVGWLDLVAVRYSAMINGATGLSLMLLDVLSGLEEVKVCVGYRVGGRETDRFLPDSADLEGVEPIYRSLPGFGEDVTGARSWSDLPAAARGFVETVEQLVGLTAEVVSVGPGREQTIRRHGGTEAWGHEGSQTGQRRES